MSGTWLEDLTKGYRSDPEYLAERLVLDLNEQVIERMHRRQLRRSDIARQMGVSKSYVTKLLRGNSNMTLQTLVSLSLAVGAVPRIEMQPHHKHLELIDSWDFEQMEGSSSAPANQIKSAAACAAAA